MADAKAAKAVPEEPEEPIPEPILGGGMMHLHMKFKESKSSKSKQGNDAVRDRAADRDARRAS